MHIANLTPDPIEWMHIGVTGTLKPGDIKEFDDRRGSHILTKFARRGLVKLAYNDDLTEKRKQALESWEKFWRYQVTVFNQDNERRQSTNREYVYPTRELEEHAKELGMKLVGPWTQERNEGTDMKAVMDMLAKVNEQNAIIAQLTQQVAELHAKQGGTAAAAIQKADEQKAEEELKISKQEAKKTLKKFKEEEVKNDVEPYLNEFMGLNKEDLTKWVLDNADFLQSNSYPRAAYEMLKTRWENINNKKDPFPLLDS